jgi:hypothetical protein
MKILLDIDDTAIITTDGGKTWNRHPLLFDLIDEHKVVLYSGHPDIALFANVWGTTGYIPKGYYNTYPRAGVLIDNHSVSVTDCKLYINCNTVSVPAVYRGMNL